MRTHSLTLADTIADVEAVSETRGDAHAVVDNLANTIEELEALGDTWGDADALVDTG